MRRNIFKEIKGDLWIVLLDVISVNAAWLIGFLLRYYVHSEFLPSAMPFVTNYLHFAPFYTILCILIFSEFGIYHGIWRNARFKDLGRIIGANVATLVLTIIIISIFKIRLPRNVCVIATAIQLVLILIIRYSRRIVKAERWKIEKRKGNPRRVLVIGDDVKARSMIKLLSTDSKYKPAVIIGKTEGEKVFNVPVIETQDYVGAIKEHGVNCIIIASPIIESKKKKELERYCQKKDIEFIDYSVSAAKLLLNIPIFTLIKMFIRGMFWEFFYEWE